jgi:hypothetical protein
MLESFKKSSDKAGLPPGTPVHIGEKKTEQVRNASPIRRSQLSHG